MSRKHKQMLIRIGVSAALLIACALSPLEGIWRLLAFLVPYAVIGWDVLWKAVRNIAHGQVFDENFLMSIATVGAFATGEYPEAVFVMLFYQVGELFQSYAVGRSRQSIAQLMEIRPDYANLERDGKAEKVDPDEVAVGDVIVVKPGERVPLDGVVLEGHSTLDTAALTGESLPPRCARAMTSSAAASTRAGFCACASPRSSANPPWPKFSIWWKMPAARRPAPKTSSPSSPAYTRPAWSSPPCFWRWFPRSLPAIGASGRAR